jgi:hypothetical protein
MTKELILLIHIIICLYLSFYALIIKNTKYDYIYLMFLYFIIIHWLFFKGNCILSYLFKKIQDNNYELNSYPKDDDCYYLFGEYRDYILAIKNILILLNIYILYKRNNNYKCKIIIFILLLIYIRLIHKYNY